MSKAWTASAPGVASTCASQPVAGDAGDAAEQHVVGRIHGLDRVVGGAQHAARTAGACRRRTRRVGLVPDLPVADDRVGAAHDLADRRAVVGEVVGGAAARVVRRRRAVRHPGGDRRAGRRRPGGGRSGPAPPPRPGPEKSGGCDGSVKISAGATSSRIADACIAAACANIACMNDGGSSSCSIECAPIGSSAAAFAVGAIPATISAATTSPSVTSRPGARRRPSAAARRSAGPARPRSTGQEPRGRRNHPRYARANSVIEERSLIGVDAAEDVLGVMPGQFGEHARALGDPRAEHGVVRGRRRASCQRGDRVALRHRALPQPGDLREHEPHPVPGLASRAQLDDGRGIDAPLGGDEALEVVWIARASHRHHRYRGAQHAPPPPPPEELRHAGRGAHRGRRGSGSRSRSPSPWRWSAPARWRSAARSSTCVASPWPSAAERATAAAAASPWPGLRCPSPLDASDPAWAGADVDFTALPIPKPAAIAITSSTPSSHHRRSICTPSLRPVPR